MPGPECSGPGILFSPGVRAPRNRDGVALFRILDAAKSDGPGAIVTGRHQQQLSVLIVSVGLGEIPHRTLRLIVAAAAQDGGASVLVDVLIRPLPYVAYHIDDPEGAGAFGMCIDIAGRKHCTAFVGSWRDCIRRTCRRGTCKRTRKDRRNGPVAVSPGELAPVIALRGMLPLP